MAAAVVADLDPPDALIRRWGVLAAAHRAIGIPDVFVFDGRGAELDDHGGNWAAMTFPGGGRAVFFGFDHDYSRTPEADPPIDLLADGPDWLPWSRLDGAGTGLLGWCYWFEDGEWRCSPEASAAGVEDGHLAVAGDLLSDQRTLVALGETVTGWGRPSTTAAPSPSLVAESAVSLLDAARESALDAARLQAFVRVGRHPVELHIDAGLSAAAAAGLTPGSRSPMDLPAAPAAPPARPPRRRRRISEAQLEAELWAAMRAAPEQPRDIRPARKETKKLVDYLRKKRYLGSGDRPVTFRVCGNSFASDSEPQIDSDDSLAVFRLVHGLRSAETTSGQGSWLFMRLSVDGRHVQIERAFDRWPSWWTEEIGLFFSDLQSEMEARDPAWRPAWAALLLPDASWETI